MSLFFKITDITKVRNFFHILIIHYLWGEIGEVWLNPKGK